ncbi:MAG: dipeptide epimerase [Alphaproteobacteria bacterium]|nr:dipeptide epimerase [Alphaproteobacteria bacterium]
MSAVVRAVRTSPLEAPLHDPFVIANARLDHLRNVAVEVELDDGTVGVGEIAALPPITRETQREAEQAVERVGPTLAGLDPSDAEAVEERLRLALPELAATRAGIEQACWDAAARAAGQPLWRRFGATAHDVITDVTLPMVDPDRAATLATQWRERGFRTLKIKVGRNLHDDLARIGRVVEAHPSAGLVLDANEGWSVQDALTAVRATRRLGGRIALLEQPVPRDDLDALARLNRDAGVMVAADEAVHTEEDVARIASQRIASCINVKLAKSGVAGALRLIAAARREGLATMIGAMVESRIGTGFAAHLAAGLGGFTVVDLDTSLLLAEDPVLGGTVLDGPRWEVTGVDRGHGGGVRR